MERIMNELNQLLNTLPGYAIQMFQTIMSQKEAGKEREFRSDLEDERAALTREQMAQDVTLAGKRETHLETMEDTRHTNVLNAAVEADKLRDQNLIDQQEYDTRQRAIIAAIQEKMAGQYGGISLGEEGMLSGEDPTLTPEFQKSMQLPTIGGIDVSDIATQYELTEDEIRGYYQGEVASNTLQQVQIARQNWFKDAGQELWGEMGVEYPDWSSGDKRLLLKDLLGEDYNLLGIGGTTPTDVEGLLEKYRIGEDFGNVTKKQKEKYVDVYDLFSPYSFK